MAAPRTLTRLLNDWRDGDRQAFDAVMVTTYEMMRRVARAQLRNERPGHTLDSVALVGEVYQRLVDQGDLEVEHRGQFIGIASRVMRQILVDHARRRDAQRHGGGLIRVELDAERDGAPALDFDVLALHEALERLEKFDPELVQVIELKIFAGMTTGEIADALNIGSATVTRKWRIALARLQQTLQVG